MCCYQLLMQWIHSRYYLITELALLSLGFPLFILEFHLQKLMLPALWAVAIYCLYVRRAVDGTQIRADWQWSAVHWANLRPILWRFTVCAVAMAVLTIGYFPDKLFNFVQAMPWFWALVMLLYPLLSVVAQEIIYRWFFMRRYQPLFTSERSRILASGVAFALGHIIFNNWVAPLLCLVGGMIFAATYAKSRSLALVSLEHALYGDFLFTIGLGSYFYHGSVH